MKTNWKKQNIEKSNSSYINLVEKIERAQNKPTRYSGTIATMLLEFFGKTSKKRNTWKRATFKRLLIHMYNQKCYGLLRDYKSVEVLHNISAFGNQMVRNVESWKRNSLDKEAQLRSLIRYSFAMYETPVFLENTFFEVDKRYMLWYIQLGKGKSVKELSQMPVRLTSKMAHEFKNSPNLFKPNQALRFAQAIGFGASLKTAKVIVFSKLSAINESEEKFWTTVVEFFAKETDINTKGLDKILEFLDFKYRENKDFSMKSRTLKALEFQADEWQKRVYKDEIGKILNWATSGITPLYKEETEKGKTVVYKTVELLNSIALYDEGIAMHHCVAEYDTDCKDGLSTIFSLRKEIDGEPAKRLATIEVGLDEKLILEAKAKYNEEPSNKSFELMDLWIKSSEIEKIEQVAYNVEQHNHNERVVHNVNHTEDENYNIAVIVKVIFWMLYLMAKAGLFSS
tara:strand:+ start:3691 stop:5055 length:1365 start_codon:yes stop_codon:yes gene_type:complete